METCYFCHQVLPESELEKLHHLLQEHDAIIGYHGTTVELAKEILTKGFRLPPLSQILKDSYQVCRIPWTTRNKFPRWARDFMEHEARHRIAIEKYSSISFAPKEVARRWAGWGGEVLHEVVRNIEVIKAFWATELPKTEAAFDAWYETQNASKFYRNVGDPAIIKALLQLTPRQAKAFKLNLEHLLKWAKEMGNKLDAFQIWDHEYKDYKVFDLKQIILISLEEPKTMPKYRL